MKIKDIIILILVLVFIILIVFLILGKLSYKWDKQQTLCEKSGGVIVYYECQESFLSAFRCGKVETGTFCVYSNGTKYKLVYE